MRIAGVGVADEAAVLRWADAVVLRPLGELRVEVLVGDDKNVALR